jgi:hypothetical protein
MTHCGTSLAKQTDRSIAKSEVPDNPAMPNALPWLNGFSELIGLKVVTFGERNTDDRAALAFGFGVVGFSGVRFLPCAAQ